MNLSQPIYFRFSQPVVELPEINGLSVSYTLIIPNIKAGSL